jgi:Golgi phosphoprotein 3 (GPP34)
MALDPAERRDVTGQPGRSLSAMSYVCRVRVSANELQGFSATPPPPPPPVEPILLLCEELVLLSIGAPRKRVRRIVRLAARAHSDSRDYKAVLASLKQKGLLEQTGPRESMNATDAAKLAERRTRVLDLVRNPSPLTGSDAELVVLLAASEALRLNAEDRRRARHRVAEIKDRHAASSVELVRLDAGVDSMTNLAELLFPADRSFGDANFDPGVSAGVWMAGSQNC